MPLIENKIETRSRLIGFQSRNVAIWNTERFKLVVTQGGAPEASKEVVELFDLISDPSETKVIATLNPDVVERMTLELKGCRNHVGNRISGEIINIRGVFSAKAGIAKRLALTHSCLI